MGTPTTMMKQEETGLGIGQNDKLESNQVKTLRYHTLFWKKDINF